MAVEELIARYEAGGGELAKANAEGLAVPPALHTVVLTCMDSRIDVFALFGLSLGEVHVLRNAGGVVTDDVIRSLTISQRKLATRDILIMQHTGCGLNTFTDDDFSEELADEVGMRPPWRTHAFRDPVLSVRRGMKQLLNDPFLVPGTRVRGFVVDIEAFTLEEVLVDEGAPTVLHTPATGVRFEEPGEPAAAQEDRADLPAPPRVRPAAGG